MGLLERPISGSLERWAWSWKSRARQFVLHEMVIWIRARPGERHCHLRSAHVQVGGYFKRRRWPLKGRQREIDIC